MLVIYHSADLDGKCSGAEATREQQDAGCQACGPPSIVTFKSLDMKDDESVYAQIFEQLLEHIDSVPSIGMMTSKEMAIHAMSLEDNGWTVNEGGQLINSEGTTYLEAFGPKGIGFSDENPMV